jgi:hypothetical protein
VRALIVEDLHELVEARLLLKKIAGGRLGSLFLQREMHAFMAAVLLRMAGLDPFDADAQAQPPHRELAQIKQGVSGSEGHTVIAADVGGQATLLKKPLKHSESVLFPGRRKGFTGEQKAAGMVGDRQRITVLVIAEQELSFVIGAPQFIGALAKREHRALCATTHPTAAFHQATAIQHRMDGALGWHSNTREPAKQTLTDFARTPARVLTLDVQNVVFYLKRKLVGIAIRTPASVGEPLKAAFLVTIEDLIARLSGNAKLPAKFRHRLAG